MNILLLSLLPAKVTEKLDEACMDWMKKPDVIFAQVLNNLGRPVAGGFKKKTPKMSQEKTKTLFSQLKLDSTMRREFDEYLGELDYTISKRKKMSVISIPITDYLVIMAVKNEENTHEIAEKIIKDFGKILV